MSDDTDTGPIPLDSSRGRRQLVRFDPTINSGTILTIISMLVGLGGFWATYQSDKATTRLEIDTMKSAAAAEKVATKETLTDIKGDVKEIQRTLVQVNQTLAVIEAKQQPKGGKP